jgi:hypothetical protein
MIGPLSIRKRNSSNHDTHDYVAVSEDIDVGHGELFNFPLLKKLSDKLASAQNELTVFQLLRTPVA